MKISSLLHFLPVIINVSAFSATCFLLGKKPFTLSGNQRIKATALVGNSYLLLTISQLYWLRAKSALFEQALLICLMCFLTINDIKEKQVFDIHLNLLMLCGLLGSPLWMNMIPITSYLLFGVLYLVLLAVAKRRNTFSIADAKAAACLTLYFSFSAYLEVMILALGFAVVVSIAGMLTKKANLKTELPFMPFLLIAILVEYFLQ